ncbi:MAG: hypothetical protein ACKV19_16260 [Verrucomicrobiales bacterium]
MERNTRLLLLVSVASFAVGAAASGVLFSLGGEDPEQAREDVGVPGTKAPARWRGGDFAPGEENAQAGGRGEGKRGNGRSQNEREDGIPDSVKKVLHSWERGGSIDAEVANRLLGEMPLGPARRHLLHRIAHLWSRQDPKSAADWANTLEAVDRQQALQEVLHLWSEDDPAGAAEYVVQLPTSEQNLHLVHAMAQRWAERDQAAAMAWGAALTSPAHRERAIGGMVSSWAQSDPQAAAHFAASIESYYERYRVLEVAAQRWAVQDTAAAMAWAQGLPDEDRQRATQSILREVAERDPRGAAMVYEELTANLTAETRGTHDYRRMAEEIASVWSSSSPREAADWAVGLPEEGEVRRSAVGNVAEHWLRIDGMAAGEWILQLPEGATRDAAAERVVHSTMQSDPAAAFAWANSLSNEGHRAGLIRDVLRGWSSIDAASAQVALGGANLPPQRLRELSLHYGLTPPVQPAPGE